MPLLLGLNTLTNYLPTNAHLKIILLTFQGTMYTEKCDVYSVAMTLHEMLSEELPYPGNTIDGHWQKWAYLL